MKPEYLPANLPGNVERIGKMRRFVRFVADPDARKPIVTMIQDRCGETFHHSGRPLEAGSAHRLSSVKTLMKRGEEIVVGSEHVLYCRVLREVGIREVRAMAIQAGWPRVKLKSGWWYSILAD